jgi:hypothetical protein
MNGFLDFLAHVGKKPSLKHSLDRIDNNRGYEPGNVRWATAKEQMQNRRLRLSIEQFPTSALILELEKRGVEVPY